MKNRKGKPFMKKQYIKRFLATMLTGVMLFSNVVTGDVIEVYSKEELNVTEPLPKEDSEENDEVSPPTPTKIPGTKIEDLVEDSNFVEYLKASCDSDGNGYMTDSEINNVRIIDVTGQSIGTLSGIEKFNNLEILLCSDNNLSSLDLSGNSKLTQLECSKNQISELDLSKNVELATLKCSKTGMDELKMVGCSKLKELDCSGNNLSELSVQFMKELTELDCSNNLSLNTLNLRNNPKLKVLTCYQCSLDSLNVKSNTALEELYCGENDIVVLELKDNKQLKRLECNDNSISSLDIS